MRPRSAVLPSMSERRPGAALSCGALAHLPLRPGRRPFKHAEKRGLACECTTSRAAAATSASEIFLEASCVGPSLLANLLGSSLNLLQQ